MVHAQPAWREILGHRHAAAAVTLSMEAVFAALFGQGHERKTG
jgi:hypothetical protein